FYPALEPKQWDDEIVIYSSRGANEVKQLYDVLEAIDEPAIAAQLFPSANALQLHGIIGSGFSENRSKTRIRAAVAESNAQLRNGQRHRPAPGICIIFHESLDFAGEDQVVAALLGDRVHQIIDGVTIGEGFFGRGGAWTASKNRGVSALRYVRTQDSVTTIVNPWAEYPVDFPLFEEPVLIVRDGRVCRELVR